MGFFIRSLIKPGMDAAFNKADINKALKKSVMRYPPDTIPAFVHNGQTHNKRAFVDFFAESLVRQYQEWELKEQLGHWEKKLPRSETPDFIQAIIEAYQLAISKK